MDKTKTGITIALIFTILGIIDPFISSLRIPEEILNLRPFFNPQLNAERPYSRLFFMQHQQNF